MNRERLTILRDHLASLPDERFEMAHYFADAGAQMRLADLSDAPEALKSCGTAACIAGWSVALWGGAGSTFGTDDVAQAHLGLGPDQAELLFRPMGWMSDRITRADGVAAIQSMLDTRLTTPCRCGR